MATVRKGFTPYRKFGGGVYTGGREKAYVSNGYATALGVGDPIYVSNGLIRIAANTSTGEDALTNPGREYGVFVGCNYIDSNGQPQESTYFPAATSSTGRLEDQTQVIGYYAPAREYSFLAIASASVSSLGHGSLYAVTVSSPNALFKRSTAKINAAVASAGVDHMVRVIGFPNIAGTKPDDATTIVEVEFALPGNPW